MKSPSEVKVRAVKLRDVLRDMGHKLKHSDTLEVVSKLEGYPDWNTYSAELAKGQQTAEGGLDDIENEVTINLPDPTKMPEDGKLAYCSFCGRSQHEVRKLIAGPSVFICDICTDMCIDIVLEEMGLEEMSEEHGGLKDMPTLSSLIRKAQDKDNRAESGD